MDGMSGYGQYDKDIILAFNQNHVNWFSLVYPSWFLDW